MPLDQSDIERLIGRLVLEREDLLKRLAEQNSKPKKEKSDDEKILN